jgi:hypothetical protein
VGDDEFLVFGREYRGQSQTGNEQIWQSFHKNLSRELHSPCCKRGEQLLDRLPTSYPTTGPPGKETGGYSSSDLPGLSAVDLASLEHVSKHVEKIFNPF